MSFVNFTAECHINLIFKLISICYLLSPAFCFRLQSRRAALFDGCWILITFSVKYIRQTVVKAETREKCPLSDFGLLHRNIMNN